MAVKISIFMVGLFRCSCVVVHWAWRKWAPPQALRNALVPLLDARRIPRVLYAARAQEGGPCAAALPARAASSFRRDSAMKVSTVQA